MTPPSNETNTLTDFNLASIPLLHEPFGGAVQAGPTLRLPADFPIHTMPNAR